LSELRSHRNSFEQTRHEIYVKGKNSTCIWCVEKRWTKGTIGGSKETKESIIIFPSAR
jgi:hypothetical protein